MKKLKINWISIVSFLFLTTSGCRKMIAVDLPFNQLTTGAVFSDSTNATAAISGLYLKFIGSSLQPGFGNGAITIYTSLAADEMYGTAQGNVANEFYSNSITAENPLNNQLWSDAFQLIYHANACIAGLTHNTAIKEPTRNHLLSEAKTIRAFVYFNLVNLFGDVPWLDNINYTQNAILPRTASAVILTRIQTDLEESRNFLPELSTDAESVRLTHYAATAILARLYLFTRQWSKAETAATSIIASNQFSLESDLKNVFLTGSTEAIWQLRPVEPGFETAEGYQFVPASATRIPRYVISTALLASFEVNDQRPLKWLRTNINNGQPYTFPYKYKLGYDGNTSPLESNMILRLAELYLIRGEARAQQSNLTGPASAAADIDVIRHRSGLPNTSAATMPQMVAALEKERRSELFAEWGHRWYDLKRTGVIDNRLSAKPGWQPTDSLFPIPFSEIQTNPALHQNPGY